MLRYFFVLLFALPLSTSAAETRIGIANQHKSALDVKNGRFTGVLAQAFQCPLDRSGLSFDMLMMPHARVLLQLKRGEIDIAIPLVQVDRRDQYATFSKPLLEVEFALFSLKPVNQEQDLSNYTFTVLRSTASVDLVKQRNGKVIEVSSWPQALELARLGRYDGAVIPLASIANLPAENFEGLQQFEFGWLPIGFYISQAIPKRVELLQKLNAAIDACRG